MLSRDQWTLTAVREEPVRRSMPKPAPAQTRAYIQTVADINGDPVYVRSYRHDVLPPRMVGLRFTWEMAH